MKSLLEDVKSVLRNNAPKEYRNEIVKIDDPQKLIMYLDHETDSATGNYVVDSKNDMIVLNSYCSRNSLVTLPKKLTFDEFKNLIESQVLKLDGIRGIYSLTMEN